MIYGSWTYNGKEVTLKPMIDGFTKVPYRTVYRSLAFHFTVTS